MNWIELHGIALHRIALAAIRAGRQKCTWWPILVAPSRLPCSVFCIFLLTSTNKYQKYKSVELGDLSSSSTYPRRTSIGPALLITITMLTRRIDNEADDNSDNEGWLEGLMHKPDLSHQRTQSHHCPVTHWISHISLIYLSTHDIDQVNKSVSRQWHT